MGMTAGSFPGYGLFVKREALRSFDRKSRTVVFHDRRIQECNAAAFRDAYTNDINELKRSLTGTFNAAAIRLVSRIEVPGSSNAIQMKRGIRDTLPQFSVNDADGSLDTGDTTAATRSLNEAQPTSQSRPQAHPSRRLLLACTDEVIRTVLAPLQETIGKEIIDEVSGGPQLEESLQNKGPYSLVISQAALGSVRGLDVLSKARDRGDDTPFILIQSIHQNFVRITIGGGPNSIVSTRLVGTAALLDLVEYMVRQGDPGPASPQ